MNILVDKRLGMLKTSAVAAACLTLMSFLVACGGGAGSANSSSWGKAITPPKLTVISPPVGPTTGGTPVAITGTDIQQGATVVFGDVPAAQINSVTSTSIEAVTPVHDPASVDVKVTNPDTGSDTLLAAFTFTGSPLPSGGLPPTISSVFPNTGPLAGETDVTISGTNFQSTPTVTTVTFGQTPASVVTFLSAAELKATTPAHAEGPVDVIVRNPDGQSATLVAGFTYATPPLTITSVSPASGTIAGDTSVTITGTGFQPGVPGTTVTFGAVAGTGVNVLSSTKIQVTTPAHAEGAVDVKVTNPDSQSVTLPGGYTYVTSPIIDSLSVDSGLDIGGTPVTIRGSNFAGGASVTFGTLPAASVSAVSATRIDVTTPPQPAGTIVDVTVTNPDTKHSTLPSAFRYGQILLKSGLETGNFSEWKSCAPADKCSVVTTPAAVHSGTHGAQLQYRMCGNPITDPSTLVGEASGGSLGARTYYVKYTYANATGETGSAMQDLGGGSWPVWEPTKAVSANYLFTFASPPASYQMTKYNVYLSTSAGTEALQTLTPVDIGTNWTEPSSCPGGHTCVSGTNLVNDTAAARDRDNNTAGCGDAHADTDTRMFTDTTSLFPGGEYPEGIRHFWIRGYVKIAQPSPVGGVYQQRKLFYLMGKDYHADCGGSGQFCWSYVLGGSPESKNALSSSAGSYAGTRCDGQEYGPGTALGPWQHGEYRYIPTSTFAYAFNTWYYFEVEVKANDPPNTCTGAIRVWVSGGGYDNKLILDDSPANVGGNRAEGIDRLYVGEQVDRFHYKPINEDRYWDDVVVGDAYVGPQVPPP